LCAETAHILMDECGSPCRMTGCQLRPIVTPAGKLTPELIKPYLQGFGDHHHSQPKAIYLSQCTEMGTVYTVGELKAITDLAHQHNMFVHMDGARIANAAAFLNSSLKEITTDCGIDILSFGGTKNGMMMGECVVILNPELTGEARFIRKQSAQLASKMRFLSCQFTAYFENQLWLTNARHANQMAQRIYQALSCYPEITFLDAVESNVMFLRMPAAWARELRKDYFFYFLNEEQGELRLVTSFDSTVEDVDGLIAKVGELATQHICNLTD
ncbi:MAG: beta-eliminating lyase-related protein, partial [Bacteroidales bacterium]